MNFPEDVLDHYSSASDFYFVRDGDLKTISAPIDFLGVNYYVRHMVREDAAGRDDVFSSARARVVIPHGAERTATGWPIEPEGLTELLLRLDCEYTKLPIYITENGCALNDYADPEGCVNDEERIAYLDAHLRAAHEAMAGAWTFEATSPGRFWITSSGRRGTRSGSGSCT